jgi:hypothetical protein
MRKITIIIPLLAGLALASGCGKKGAKETAAEAPVSEVLARYHFVGSAQLAGNTNAAKLKEIRGLAETQQFVEQTLHKLAHAPQTLYRDKITPEQDERGAVLLRPLLDDLLLHESFLQVRGAADQTAEWSLLVQLPADRLKLWGLNLGELMRVWKLGTAATNTLEGFPGWEVKRSDAPNVIRWVEAGQWLAVGVAQNDLPTLDEGVKRIKAAGRPIPAASGYWLETELNLPRLVKALDLSPAIKWPHAKLSLIGAGENVRSTMRLAFSEPVTVPLNPWRLPTNIVGEPLISFTAMRGIAPWLETSKTLQKLGLAPVPNELYFWAQAHVAFQSFVAFPAKDPKNTLERIANRAPSLFSAEWQRRNLTNIAWQATNNVALWKRLPYITPFAQPARSGETEFIFGGLFPPAPFTNPPPAELLSQFAGRNDLVYYDWEITQARLTQWRIVALLFAVIADKPQLSTNNAGLPWLIKAESHLGNSVTEITARSPREWSLTRKSHIGFTGVELVALTRWLESTNFPRLSFELPPDRPAPSGRPPAAP